MSDKSYDAMPYETGTVVLPSPLSLLGGCYVGHGIENAKERYRCLDIGCGIGYSTLALARAHPEIDFVGIDLSEKQIEMASETAAGEELGNIRFQSRNFLDLDQDGEPYDIIYCYGVFSWCPRELQSPLLKKMPLLLAPSGVALVSYNVFPGWHSRGILREVMLQGVDRSHSPGEQVRAAKEFTEFFMKGLPDNSVYGYWLAQHYTSAAKQSDVCVYYDLLTEDNNPLRFEEFAALCQQAGLRFVSEYPFTQSRLPENASASHLLPYLKSAKTDDKLRFEQAMDLAAWRPFRRSLVCRDDCELLEEDPERYRRCRFHLGPIALPGELTAETIRPGMSFEAVAPYGKQTVIASPYEIGILVSLREERSYESLWEAVRQIDAVVSYPGGVSESIFLRDLHKLSLHGFTTAFPAQ